MKYKSLAFDDDSDDIFGNQIFMILEFKNFQSTITSLDSSFDWIFFESGENMSIDS